MVNKNFVGSRILVTGGTGSFGTVFARHMLGLGVKSITIISRDEKKQYDLRLQLADERACFVLADVRDYDSIRSHFDGIDYVFHAAALKQVPSCEFFPLEAVKTNILGTNNVISASQSAGVKKLIALSTDKAVYPINAMGLTKGLLEKLILSRSRESSSTILACTRYGNVMASRGSVIPRFISQIKARECITVTYSEMTRFLMSLENSIQLVLYAFLNAEPGDIFIQKAPAATVGELAAVLKKLYQSSSEIVNIGFRHGEKLFETLCSSEEMIKSVDHNQFLRIPNDVRGLNYESYFTEGSFVPAEPYTSHNTKRLSESELITTLLALPLIKNDIK